MKISRKPQPPNERELRIWRVGRALTFAFIAAVLTAGGISDLLLSTARPVQHHGAELVAAAFGMDPEATMIYLSDHFDETRLGERAAAYN
ncbi:hypothetical protein ACFWBR_16835 [Streptomyces sp. NPDC060006]|uniref:hypothetical protein n=1 Tax=unclassified Streptomyces TaxID=2593676 RepID=UPI0036344A54